MQRTPKEALEAAIKEAGSQAALAELIECTQPAVSDMLKKGQASDRYAVPISQKTSIPLKDLRPDWFKDTETQSAA